MSGSIRQWVLVIAAFACALTACAKPQMWYQVGKGQVDYNRDAQECVLIASNFARQATMTGNSEDPASFGQTMRNCLAAKGWSANRPQTNPTGQTAKPLTVPLMAVDGNTVQAFGRSLSLPPAFTLLNTAGQDAAEARSQTLTFAREQTTYVTIMAQELVGKANRFTPTPYVAKPPFFLYGQDGLPAESKTPEPHWSTFCGIVNDQWVMGLGSFVLINDKQRITVIVTEPLIALQTAPEKGFRLSRQQFTVVDAFAKQWTDWLAGEQALVGGGILSELVKKFSGPPTALPTN